MMMSLDMFVFSLDTLAYQELQRRTAWRWPTSPRVGARPAAQFAGLGDDNISLGGLLLPHFKGDPTAFETLRGLGDQGVGLELVTGAGDALGMFALVSLDENQGVFMVDGRALKTDFRLELMRIDNDRLE